MREMTERRRSLIGAAEKPNLLNVNVPRSYPSNTSNVQTARRTFTPNTYVSFFSTNNYYDAYAVSGRSNLMVAIYSSNSCRTFYSNGWGVAFVLLLDPGATYRLTGKVKDYSGTLIRPFSVCSYTQNGTWQGAFEYMAGDVFTGNSADSLLIIPSGAYYTLLQFRGVENAEVTWYDLKLVKE